MEMPSALRRVPPRAALDWVAASTGPRARVVGVRRLRNAWASAVHAVDVEDDRAHRHELVLRRWARTDLPPDDGVVENEAAALQLLAAAPAPVTPQLLACDPEARRADVPALVMTRLPGHVELAPADLDAYLDGLAASLRAIHALPRPGASLDTYRPWGLDDAAVPPWTNARGLWTDAIELARAAVPAFAPVFCHRDFHPGNVLWRHATVTGVVDWTHACTGPAAADVAHCRANLALLFGLGAADDFARRYGPVDDLAWFDLVDIVGMSALDAWRWQDAGRLDVTPESLAQGADAFLADAVRRLG